MNFMGMGPMELGVIFLISFLVLGPSKSIDLARTAGKMIRDVRRTFADLASTVDLEQRGQSSSHPPGPAAETEENDSGPSKG